MQSWILDESPGAYRFGEIDILEPGPGDVRVRVVASALNHMDLWVTRGLPKPKLPHVPGADGAGIVEAVGEGVTSCAVGDEVVLNPAVSCRRCPVCLSGESPLCRSFGILGEHRWGAHGELVLVPAENVVAKPPSLSWEEAAAYPLVYLTAWRMLKRARLRAGETMLVVGVGGGVSAAGLALGVAMGAEVYGTSRDEAKRDRAVAMGAAGAFDSGEDFPVKADVVFENVGAATWDRSLRALAPGGRLVTCGGTAGSKVEISLPRLFFKQHEIIGSTMGSYAEFDEVTRLVATGRVPVVVDQAMPAADFPAALERLERGDQLGKLVLRH
jgi:NADPH:quinone reductase-like Zn-dependent oxidoreductase